jgi:hypothetical protein
LLKKLQPKSPQNQQSTNNVDATADVDNTFNLLGEPTIIKGLNKDTSSKLVDTFQALILGLSLLLIASFCVNLFANNKALQAASDLKNTYSGYLQVQNTSKQLVAFKSQEDLYVTVITGQKKFVNRTQLVFNAVGSNVQVDSLKVNSKGFDLSAHGASIYAFSKLIASLLSNDSISDVSIVSASINDTALYVSLHGDFVQ